LVVRPGTAAIPISLTRDCAPAADLPDRALGNAETVRLWAADRAALQDCRLRHHALAAAAAALENQGE
jgi:hypothetical protein